MKDRYVVDTNVLIAASSSDPVCPKNIDATPEDPTLRMQVWTWLDRFQGCESHLVLDRTGAIFDEYKHRLGFQDFGILVVMRKWDKAAVDCVDVNFDINGHGVLPATLSPVIHDLDDRKMVAAALESHVQHGEGCVAFAGDTDWHDWEFDLAHHHVLLEPIIEAWSRMKHAEKRKR